MSELTPGKPVELAPGVRRVLAPNPGMMTGPGTNTYLLGEREVTVLDPGPPSEEHCRALLDAVAERGGRIVRIVCTHTHPDHSPATALLRQHVSAEVVGARIEDDGRQDRDFAPDTPLRHDAVLDLEGGGVLRAIHTPGHVDNHYCFLHESSGLLFTGDHIMQGSTVVIVPPAGDMKRYIESLRLLRNYPLKALAPGHGALIDDPRGEVERLVEHRLRREAKVLSACRELGQASLEQLVAPVYDDVDAALHPVAKFSLWAHLLKLQQDGRVVQKEDVWCLLNP
jgi:glyoxylase-like metal-dependent hydrolase (beta-lactamase superfamily II)